MDGTNFSAHISKFIGETVTVFTESGGESGSGFTGVILSVNTSYLRLVAKFGPAPSCALGNCCDSSKSMESIFDNCMCDEGKLNTIDCDRKTVGSVVDIPICAISAFVHNAIQ